MADTTTETTVTGGSALEALTAIGGVVLAIIGLAHVARYGMAGTATIVIGAALVLEGGALFGRMRAVRRVGTTAERAPIGGPAATDVIAGIAGIVLGAFALAGWAPLTLIPIANIVFGGAVILAAMGTAQVHTETVTGEHTARVERSTSNPELLGGVAAVTLGILALIGIAPLALSLIALLAVGASVLLGGPSMIARTGWGVRHEVGFGRRHEVGPNA